MRYPSIPENERQLAEDLIWNRGGDPITAFAGYFKAKGAAPRQKVERAGTPVERLPRYILEGSKEGLVEDLEAVRGGGMAPLDIINGPLMDGMREVGRLFNANELIVAEVLQSAEAMKAAVNHLQKFMEKLTDAQKGKILLATVKGDVHDIGKNLVDVILSQRLRLSISDKGSAGTARRGVRGDRPDRSTCRGFSSRRAADGHDRAGRRGA
jgi:5-methyltetrahydrofolate--homocysteine methyltransferase